MADPTFRRPELDAVTDDLTLVADLLGGTRQMHTKAATYIRQWTAEENAVYAIRSTCETVFEGLGRTLNAGIGMLYAKAPTIDWRTSETAISPHWDNLDAAGTKGTVLVKRFSESATRDGLALILVDHPPAPADTVVTAANEVALGLRPTWALYDRAQAINWRTAVVNNQRVLTLLVLSECAEAEDGEFGIVSRQRYRVLRLVDGIGTWTLYEEQQQEGTKAIVYVIVGEGVFKNRKGQIATFLPVAIGYTGRTKAPMTATIPLLGVAWANLSHWRKSTEIQFYEMMCGFPQPTVIGDFAEDTKTGARPTTVPIGPLVAIHLRAEDGADYRWTELQGTSLEQLKSTRQEKLEQMGKLGLAFLITESRVAETARAKEIESAGENSTLATAAQGIEDAVNMALEFHAWFLGIEKAGAPTIAINRDFQSTVLDAPTMLAYVAAFRDAGFPVRLVLEAFQRGGRIPEDADLDEIEGEMIANEQAKAKQAAQEAQDALAMQQDKAA